MPGYLSNSWRKSSLRKDKSRASTETSTDAVRGVSEISAISPKKLSCPKYETTRSYSPSSTKILTCPDRIKYSLSPSSPCLKTISPLLNASTAIFLAIARSTLAGSSAKRGKLRKISSIFGRLSACPNTASSSGCIRVNISKSALSNRASRISVVALTVAVRGLPASTVFSPKRSPGPT